MITVLLLALAFAIMLLWSMYLFSKNQRRESMIAYPPTSCVSVHGRLVCS
jgi:hypothetical protein